MLSKDMEIILQVFNLIKIYLMVLKIYKFEKKL